MATNNSLTLDDVLNFEVATTPASSVADREAKLKQYEKQFDFDVNVSIASEIELERQKEIQDIRKKAESNQKTQQFLNTSDSNARIGSDDVDGLNSIADGLGKVNGVLNLSTQSMQSNLVDINANKVGGIFKTIAKDINTKNAISRANEKSSTIGSIKSFDPKKKPESKIEPITDKGNKYWNSVKRGSASIIQLGSLLYDGGYEVFERGADLVTGWDVNGHVPYKTNKVFDAMQNLKADKYTQSQQLTNLFAGSEIAGKEAEKNGESPLAASMQYLIKNGSFGDAGELISEFLPSLVLGYDAGGLAEKAVSSLATRFVAGRVASSIATGSIINPVRLAAIETLTPKIIQGAVMSGSSDLIGSVASEVEAQQQKGYSDGEAVGRAIQKSLTQAGVTALGGSLLPLRVGGDFTTVLAQSGIQGLFGYASAAAGAASIGEEITPTEGALNILLEAVTALPDVIAVGNTSILKTDIETQLNEHILDRAIADIYSKQELNDTRSVYFGAGIRELLSRVKNSKTNDRAPDTLREFVRMVQDDPDATKEVYIDAETFNQLNADYNIDIESLFESSPELQKNYQQVNDIDGLIRVPMDELLTAFSKISDEQYLNAFADSIRYAPEALTAAEARAEFAKTATDMEGDIAEIKKTFEAEKKKQKELKTVADIIGNDLSNLNFGFSADYNNNAKALVTAFYESLAAKTGVSARELYEAMPLRVVATDEQAQAIMRGDVDSFNQDAEYKNIINQYKNTDKWLKAPNGNDTKLTEQQWVMTKTESFKNWFGDWENDPGNSSKIVDENGEPMVVYHGSNKDFESFDPSLLSENTGNDGHYGAGIYFSTERAEAETYGKNVYEVFLNVKNPIRNNVDDLSKFDSEFGYNKEFKTVDKNWLVGKIKESDPNAGILAQLYSEGYTFDNVWDKFEELGGEYQGKLNLDDIGDIFENIDDSLGYYDLEFINENFGEIPDEVKKFGYDKEHDILDITDRGNAGRYFSDVVKNGGHDGVFAGSEIVIFNPEQVKSVANKGSFNSDDVNIYNQSLDRAIDAELASLNDPQVELRKIYGYRDSHLAPDAESGVSGSQIAEVYPELNNRDFTKNYGDGFKYDAKTVKIIREMQKNPDADVTIYRTVPKDIDVNAINFGDWVALTKDYADEHGEARFDGEYKIIEQVVKASDLYTDGNSIHEWGYSPKDSDIYKARLELSEQLKKLNDKLDQGIFNSTVSKKAVLGDKAELKNNPAIAKMFLDSKGIEPKIIKNKSEISDSAASLLPELNAIEYNSDITKNPDLLDRAFNALYLDKHKNVLSDPDASDFEKRQAERKISRFSNADADTKYNLINNEIAKVKSSKSDGSVNESLTRSNAIEQAKLFNSEYDAFVDNVLKQLGLDYYNQQFGSDVRGQIQFRKDKSGAVIILGKNANFSTFVHELGHHFLEMSMSFAGRPDAPEQLKADMIKVMEWSKQGKEVSDWNNLTPDQKTEVHEKFAETFEQYLFTGKAPSNELRKVFARFRSFMASVYKNIEKFLGIRGRSDLNPEIRDVMDRMLATQDAIEQVQRQRNLEFAIAQDQAMALGISPKDYLDLVEDHKAATEQAINELERNTLKDLARYRSLRSKHVKAFSEQQKRVRQQVRERVAEEVAKEPVYQVLAFLRQPVEREKPTPKNPKVIDPKTDTLLEAIAKMGGIDAKEIEATWGTDQPESYKVNVGRVKKVARKDGLSIETVAERLADYGYLSTDQHGKFDTRELEDLFTDSLSGGKYYSNQADPELFMMGDDYGLAMSWIDEFPDNGKLNIEWLKAKYGEDSDIYKAVATQGRYGLAMKGGLDPDVVAENFGYSSADAMVRDMAQARPPKEVIEERANGLIQAQYADLFDSKSIEMAIDEAVHNDIRAMMLARELTAITKLQGRQSDFNQITKSMAQNIIDNSMITEIRPHIFSAAELKHAKAYDKAIKSGNTLDAVRAKRQQLINFHAVKQAYEANNFVDKLFTLAKTVNGNDAKLAKNRDFNLVAITRYVLDLYGITDNKNTYEEHIKNLKKYDPLAARQVADLIYTTDEDGATVFRLPIKNYSEMTYTEFQVLNDIVRQIWHRSKESQKIKVGNEKIEFAQVVSNLVSTMQTKAKKSRAASFFGYTPRKATDFNPQRAFQTLKRAEQLFTWLDGGKSDGVFHKYVFNPMQDALSAYRLEQKKMMQEMINIYSEFDQMSGKIDANELGGEKTTFESKQELLHAVLHTGNESNKKRLVLGYGWGDVLEDGSIDYSRWDAFIQRMYENQVITKKDMDAIQKIWNLFDGYKAQAQEVHKNINGLYFKELPKNVINTPFGMYEGGYIPADYNRLLSVEAEQRGKANDVSTKGDQFFSSGASTGANFTKSRVESYRGDFMTLDMTQLPMHLDRELRYIYLEENLRQASKIFRNREVMNTLESVSPFAIDSVISDWLNAVANQRVSKPTDYPTIDKIANKLKQNSGIVLMAGNIKNAIEAWTSIPQLTTVVPKRELLSATSKFFTDAFSRESMVKQVRELSPFMDSRLDNSVNEMRYQIDNLVVNPSKLKKGTDFLKSNAYFIQQVFQTPLETIGWIGAYNDAIAKGMSDADAIHHADGVVRQYLNDMSPEGISKIERGTPLVRAMLMFYGWFNMVSNTWAMRNKLVSEDVSLSGLQKFGKYAGLYTMMIAMPAMLSKALTLTFNGDIFDNENEEDWAEDLINIGVKSQAEMIFGMLPFARDVINPIYRTTFNATAYSDRYSVSPIQSMIEQSVKTGKRIADATDEGEVDTSELAKGILQTATFATGVPFTMVQRPVTYGADVLIDEDQEPENGADAVRGIVSGK